MLLTGIVWATVLYAVVWGTVSSFAGREFPTKNKTFILACVFALGAAYLVSSAVLQFVGDHVFGADPRYQISCSLIPLFSSDTLVKAAPQLGIMGIIFAGFLSFFLNRSTLKTIRRYINPDDISLSLRSLMITAPRRMKILVAFSLLGIIVALLIPLTALSFKSWIIEWWLVALFVFGAAAFVSWCFLKQPTAKRGILLFGFCTAALYSLPLLFGRSLYEGLWDGRMILTQVLFALIMSCGLDKLSLSKK